MPGRDVEPPEPAVLAELGADVERVSERLRTLSQSRLAASLPDRGTRADTARELAQLLADAAQGFEQRSAPVPPAWRTLPVLSDLAVGDQVAVTGHDLMAAAAGVAPEVPVWARDGRRTAAEVVTAAAAALATTRRLL